MQLKCQMFCPFLLCLPRPHCSFMGMMISHDMLLGRWRLSLELFGRVFMEDVGAEPGSVHFYLNTDLSVKDVENIKVNVAIVPTLPILNKKQNLKMDITRASVSNLWLKCRKCFTQHYIHSQHVLSNMSSRVLWLNTSGMYIQCLLVCLPWVGLITLLLTSWTY